MRFPFGIHCGSWVRRVALLPYVSHVHVVGVTSADVGLGHAWEQYWLPILKNKITYWCTDVDVGWAHTIGFKNIFRKFNSPDELISGFLRELPRQPTYVTLDKDVLSEREVHTNWDQGKLLEAHLKTVIEFLNGQIIGSDITGDVSAYQYQTRWKKWLSALDRQTEIPQEKMAIWQKQQQQLNARLLAYLAASSMG